MVALKASHVESIRSKAITFHPLEVKRLSFGQFTTEILLDHGNGTTNEVAKVISQITVTLFDQMLKSEIGICSAWALSTEIISQSICSIIFNQCGQI